MGIPLDLLINFKGNEFEFSNAVAALSLEIHKKNKAAYQALAEEQEDILPRVAAKLTSQSFELILTNKVGYHMPSQEED
jgi:hypothetical protein